MKSILDFISMLIAPFATLALGTVIIIVVIAIIAIAAGNNFVWLLFIFGGAFLYGRFNAWQDRRDVKKEKDGQL